MMAWAEALLPFASRRNEVAAALECLAPKAGGTGSLAPHSTDRRLCGSALGLALASGLACNAMRHAPVAVFA